MTIVVTSLLVALCFVIRRHYRGVAANLKRLDDILEALPGKVDAPAAPVDPKAPTAAMLVGGYGGLGVHALLTVQRIFPGFFKNFIFVSVGVIDSATMKGVEEVDRIRLRTEAALQQYVDLAHRLRPGRRLPDGRGHRGGGHRRGCVPGGRARVPAGGLLRREAGVPEGADLPAAAPQRDRLPAPAAPAVRRA